MLHILLKKLSGISQLRWIRILYTNPYHFYPELVKTIANSEKVCKYVDIPIQHTDDKILSLMNRGSRKDILNTIELLRKVIPKIALRTTIIVGFPFETDDTFLHLLEDIRQIEFDWLGCFVYEKQKGTKAYLMSDQIKEKIKRQRYSEVMKLQQKITYQKNLSRVGKNVLINFEEENFGHAEFQSPEIDGKVFIKNMKHYLSERLDAEQKSATIDKLLKVKICSVKDVYDLEGEVIL